jgi:hypothetical protein
MSEDELDTRGDDPGEHSPERPPDDVIDEAVRLSRLARRAHDDAAAAAYRDERESLFAEYDFATRVRDDDDGPVLVAYPTAWLDDEGLVRTERIDDIERGVERSLAGPGEPDEWDAVAAANRSLAETVESADGEVHGENVRALATFASNHYAKPIAELTRGELREFREEYFPRNAWPSERQSAVITESIERAFAEAGAPCPLE